LEEKQRHSDGVLYIFTDSFHYLLHDQLISYNSRD